MDPKVIKPNQPNLVTDVLQNLSKSHADAGYDLTAKRLRDASERIGSKESELNGKNVVQFPAMQGRAVSRNAGPPKLDRQKRMLKHSQVR